MKRKTLNQRKKKLSKEKCVTYLRQKDLHSAVGINKEHPNSAFIYPLLTTFVVETYVLSLVQTDLIFTALPNPLFQHNQIYEYRKNCHMLLKPIHAVFNINFEDSLMCLVTLVTSQPSMKKNVISPFHNSCNELDNKFRNVNIQLMDRPTLQYYRLCDSAGSNIAAYERLG